jgi:hypothetical protein
VRLSVYDYLCETICVRLSVYDYLCETICVRLSVWDHLYSCETAILQTLSVQLLNFKTAHKPYHLLEFKNAMLLNYQTDILQVLSVQLVGVQNGYLANPAVQSVRLSCSKT